MIDLDEFVDELLSVDLSFLQHEYDPAKAREYYLRNRKLKGRHKGLELSPGVRRHAKIEANVEKHANAKLAQKAKHKKLQAVAKARVDKLQARLDRLKDVLEELTKQAKARSGIKTKTTTAEKQENKKANDKAKPATAAEKHAAAKRAKESREKDGDPSLSDQAKELDAKIEKVRESIAKMKKQIAEAKKKSKANTKTASNGRS